MDTKIQATPIPTLIELGPSHASAVKSFRHKAVVSTAPILTTVENETTHDLAFYEKLLTKSSTRDGCILLFSVLNGSDFHKTIGTDNKIIGMVGATFDKKSSIGDSHVAEIKGMFVSSRYRRSLVGSSLMRKLHEELEKIGITNFILEVLVEDTQSEHTVHSVHPEHIETYDPGYRAIKFYEKLGYKRVGLFKERYFHDGIYYNTVPLQRIIENMEK